MTQEEFEQTWHFKIVRPKLQHYKGFPDKEYIVSSALYNWEEENGEKITIFAIKAVDYSLENKHWITIKIGESELEECMADFEIVGDGREQYVRPVILHEFLYCLVAEDEHNLYANVFPINLETREVIGSQPVKTAKADVSVFPPIDKVFWHCIYRDFFCPQGVAAYKVPIPDSLRCDVPAVLEYIKPFRQDVLELRVAMGINKRTLQEQLSAQNDQKHD